MKTTGILENKHLQACDLLKKETPTQIFSCEFCKSFKDTCFIKHLRATVPTFAERYQ